MDWNEVLSADKLSYIMGNPPFVGARWMGEEQKKDIAEIFAGWKSAGNLDYVSCCYKTVILSGIVKQCQICRKCRIFVVKK